MELKDLDMSWKELDNGDSSTGDFRMRKFKNNEKIYIAVETKTRNKGITLKLGNKTKKLPLPEASSFEIKYVEDTDHLLVWWGLKDYEFYDHFRSMVYQVAYEANGIKEDQNCLSVFLNNILKWQDFLINKSKQASKEYIKGLFGELSYLQFLTENNIASFDEVINAWHEGDPKRDFYFDKGAIEIKATIANTPDKIKIANLKQLDETTSSNLFMGLCILNESDDKGLYLNELVSEIIKKIKISDNHLLTKFNSKLIKERFIFDTPEYYKSLKLSVYKIRTFHIKENFPRITPSDIDNIQRPGIGKVSYEIQYGNLSKFEISDQIIKSII